MDSISVSCMAVGQSVQLLNRRAQGAPPALEANRTADTDFVTYGRLPARYAASFSCCWVNPYCIPSAAIPALGPSL